MTIMRILSRFKVNDSWLSNDSVCFSCHNLLFIIMHHLPGLFCNDLKTKEGKQAGRKTSIDVLVDQYRIIICFSYEIEGSSIQKCRN